MIERNKIMGDIIRLDNDNTIDNITFRGILNGIMSRTLVSYPVSYCTVPVLLLFR